MDKIEKNGNNNKSEHFSEAIIVGCGDYRNISFGKKFLKRMYDIRETDVHTTAGGARTIAISIFDLKVLELFSLKRTIVFIKHYIECFFKRISLRIDVIAYLGHGAKTLVFINHSSCAKCPKFKNKKEEQKYHFKWLLKARKKIMKMFPQIKKVILLYFIIDEQTHKVLEAKILESSGEYKSIVISEEQRLTFLQKELDLKKAEIKS